MKNCPICGTAVEDQIEFCPVCGENLRALKPVPNAEDTGSGQSENAQSENAQSENAQSDQRRLAPKPGPSGSGKIGIRYQAGLSADQTRGACAGDEGERSGGDDGGTARGGDGRYPACAVRSFVAVRLCDDGGAAGADAG